MPTICCLWLLTLNITIIIIIIILALASVTTLFSLIINNIIHITTGWITHLFRYGTCSPVNCHCFTNLFRYGATVHILILTVHHTLLGLDGHDGLILHHALLGLDGHVGHVLILHHSLLGLDGHTLIMHHALLGLDKQILIVHLAHLALLDLDGCEFWLPGEEGIIPGAAD